MKPCSKCSVIKSLDMFYVKDKTGRLHAQCKECYKEHRKTYSVAHYKKYGDAYRERAKLRRIFIRKQLQTYMLSYLSDKGCVVCGESDPRVLEFDHLDPSIKAFGISSGVRNGYDWKRILVEIQKCRILCANCHKRHTAVQNNWYKNI